MAPGATQIPQLGLQHTLSLPHVITPQAWPAGNRSGGEAGTVPLGGGCVGFDAATVPFGSGSVGFAAGGMPVSGDCTGFAVGIVLFRRPGTVWSGTTLGNACTCAGADIAALGEGCAALPEYELGELWPELGAPCAGTLTTTTLAGGGTLGATSTGWAIVLAACAFES